MCNYTHTPVYIDIHTYVINTPIPVNACRLKSKSNVFWCCFAARFSRDLTMAMYHGSAPRDHQACLL